MILYISQLTQLSRSESRARNELLKHVKLCKLSVYVPLMLVYSRSMPKSLQLQEWWKEIRFDTHCRNALHWYQMTIKTSKFTSPLVVCSGICTEWHQMKHKGAASLTLWRGNPPVISGFPSQKSSKLERVSMSWSYDDKDYRATEVHYK